MRPAEWLLDLLFPPKCAFCGRILDRPGICGQCERALSWAGEEDGLWELPGGLRCAAPLWYEGTARRGLLRFKFQGAAGSADILGGLVAQCAAERLCGEFDAVTWVPVSRKRLRKRGYDQAELLARAACRRWNVKPVCFLTKILDNPPQSGLAESSARRANVQGAYTAAASKELRGRRVLLVDDICTTGATLSECAGALKAAGAAEVVCVAAARTPLEKNVYNFKEE